MSSHGFLRGGKYPPLCIFEGAIILPCQLLGGQMSTHAIFHRGADVRGGGKCPAPVIFTGHLLDHYSTLNPVRKLKKTK